MKKERIRRTPISGRRNVLTMKGGDTENFKYRIVNDVGDRISTFEEQGYEVVTDPKITVGDRRISNPTKEGSPVKVSVGGGTQAYLMRQKREFYDEDQAAKQNYVDETEKGIRNKAKTEADYGNLDIRKG